jgi:hypothetical protein
VSLQASAFTADSKGDFEFFDDIQVAFDASPCFPRITNDCLHSRNYRVSLI